jgi:DNA-directed RNA polymerase specialized sigma24 family protein
MVGPDDSPRPARVRDPSRRARSDPAADAGLDDLVRLAEGRFAPTLLAGAGNRDRREGLYAAAESLAGRPEHAGLCRTLIAGLQRRAQDARRSIDGRGDGAGRSSLEAATGAAGVMAYVFALARLHHPVLEAELARLQRQDRNLDESTARDIVDRAFTRVVLSPTSDLTRGPGVIAATVARERLSHYRRERSHRAASLDGPVRAIAEGRLASKEPRVEDDLASRQTTAALLRVAAGLPGRRGAAIRILIASDGPSGIVDVARRFNIPVNTAKSLIAAARTQFRRWVEQDPETSDAMRMFARRLDLRRRGAGRARDGLRP